MRKRVGQEVVALPSESFKTSDPPLTPFNKIVALPLDKIVERLSTNNILFLFARQTLINSKDILLFLNT